MILARPASSPSLYFQNSSRMLRGVDLFSPFAQGSTTAGHYDSNPFVGTFDSRMPSARRDAILNAGFDLVRQGVGSAILMDAYATGGDTLLDSRVRTMVTNPAELYIASGLRMLVNIFPHYGGGGSGDIDSYSFTGVFGDGPTGTRWSLFVYVVARVAAAIEALNKPHWIGLELFNETPNASSIVKGNWYDHYLPLLYSQVRSKAPRTTLFFQGTDFGNLGGGFPTFNDGIGKITLSRFDTNCVVGCHAYDMTGAFNHQHAGGEFDQIRGLTWPAASHPGGLRQARTEWTAAADVDLATSTIDRWTYNKRASNIRDSTRQPSSLYRYFKEFGAKTGLSKSFDVRLAIATDLISAAGGNWTNKNFGVTEAGVRWDITGNASGASASSAAQWTQDWYDLLAAAGCNMWVHHAINGTSALNSGDTFAIQSGQPPYEFNSWILRALRLD